MCAYCNKIEIQNKSIKYSFKGTEKKKKNRKEKFCHDPFDLQTCFEVITGILQKKKRQLILQLETHAEDVVGGSYKRKRWACKLLKYVYSTRTSEVISARCLGGNVPSDFLTTQQYIVL